MNPYVYRRRAISLSKVSGKSLGDLPGLFRSVFVSKISSAVAFAVVLFAASSVGAISIAVNQEIAASVYDPVVKMASAKQQSVSAVLGTDTTSPAAYPEVLVTTKGNKVVVITARPIEYVSGVWSYQLAWSRAKKANGSIYVNGSVLEATASQQGTAKVELKPKARTKVEFYSQPNKKGLLLVRKYFTTQTAPEAVACTQVAKLCPDGKTYVSPSGPNCEFAACPKTACDTGMISMPSCNGVPVQNPDTCEITCKADTSCQQLWWHDSTTTACAQKQFCGAYMYQGLKTFGSESECKADLVPPTQGLGSFRYLKVNTTISRSWVSWREIEIYDTAGNKLTPTDATAQYTWNGYPSDNKDHGSRLVIDGNVNTAWNAGETAPNCNWFSTTVRSGCGIGNQSAWIQVDLGSVKNVGKIRLLTENTPDPANAVHQLFVSSDGQSYTKLHEFSGEIKSNNWLVYPENTSTLPPVPAPLKLTSPVGGESWQVGSTKNITWTGSGPVEISVSLWFSCWESEPRCMMPQPAPIVLARQVTGNVFSWQVGKALSASDAVAEGAYKLTISNSSEASTSNSFKITQTPLAICDYAAPPVGCSYVQGPSYNAQTQCGLVLQCNTQSTSTEPTAQEAKSVSARYIKDSITISGWAAIREMEFFGPDGSKLSPASATASCDWCNYGTPDNYSVGPKGAIDGDTQKVWNAGETADNCSWYVLHMRNDGIYGYGCSSTTIRKAWLQVDFGKTVQVSKIRILPMGGSTNRIDELLGSADGQTYAGITTFKASAQSPAKDDLWLEYIVK